MPSSDQELREKYLNQLEAYTKLVSILAFFQVSKSEWLDSQWLDGILKDIFKDRNNALGKLLVV